ncbi:MAG: PorT family protein [Bacteroidales bacterium]|nr:PorT family protein [Bacteroidales bacterium]
MKKTIIFTLLLVSAACTGYSQLELKPAIGFNFSRFDSDPTFDDVPDSLIADGRAGYQVGASLAIGRKMYVEPGIFYNYMSQSFASTNFELQKSSFNLNTSYIRVPVNFGFQLIGYNTSFAGLRIYLGPSMFIPLSVKENTYPLEKEDLKSPQFDISAGAGLNIWLLFLDVSYGWGLTPMFKDDSIEAKMQSLYVNAGFRFRLKKDEE